MSPVQLKLFHVKNDFNENLFESACISSLAFNDYTPIAKYNILSSGWTLEIHFTFNGTEITNDRAKRLPRF